MRKLIVGSFLCLITMLVCSTAFSLAWYATSDFLQIQYFELNIAGDEELFIGLKNSTDKKDYSQLIEQSQLKTVDKFKPVSSMCSYKWMDKKAQNPILYESYNKGSMQFIDPTGTTPGYVLPEEIPAESGYFSQELYLYSEKNYYAVLDASTTFVIDEEKNKARAHELADAHPEMGTYEEILAQLNLLVQSARISVLTTRDDFYSYKIVDPFRNSNKPTQFGGLMDSDLDGEFDYWTKSTGSTYEKYEILYGEVNDRSKIVYDYNAEQHETLPTDERTWYNAQHSKNTNIFDLIKSNENGLTIKNESALSITENAEITQRLKDHGSLTEEEKQSYVYIPVDAFKPTRIVLSIYFEGWDFDNINCTMSGSFKTDIAFSVMDRSIVL